MFRSRRTSLASSSPSSRYLPQLDGLRAIGVLAMLADHWLAQGSPLRVAFRWGGIGMQLFFVLSGFLTTGVLLRLKRAADAGAATRRRSLRNFYARRVLRIFPAYFLVLLVAAALNYPNVRHGIGWHVAFLTNFQMALGRQPSGYHLTGPFWTLAVEEQFYLLWPCVVLLVPRRWVVGAIIAAILIAPAAGCAAVTHGFAGWGLMMPACMTFLGTGALLAVADYPEYAGRLTRAGLRRALLWGSVPGLIAFGVLEWAGVTAPWFGWAQWVVRGQMAAMFFAWVIATVVRGGRLGHAIGGAPLVSLGRVSYGVYVYHTFVAYTLLRAMTWPGTLHFTGMSVATARSVAGTFFLRLAAVVVVAAASWRWVEGPLGRLKASFPYARAERPIRIGNRIATEPVGALTAAP